MTVNAVLSLVGIATVFTHMSGNIVMHRYDVLQDSSFFSAGHWSRSLQGKYIELMTSDMAANAAVLSVVGNATLDTDLTRDMVLPGNNVLQDSSFAAGQGKQTKKRLVT